MEARMARLPRSEVELVTEARPARQPTATRLADVAHAVLRIGAGLLFLQHGLQKAFGLLGGSAVDFSSLSLMTVAGILELVGGALLIIGLGTRPVALLLAGEMLAAFAIAHLPRGGWPIQNGGELPLLYVLVFLFLAAAGAGPGPASIDAGFRRERYAGRDRM
jgi:putative oxidoreductase